MLAILQLYANFIRWIRIVFFCPINQLKVYRLTIPQPLQSRGAAQRGGEMVEKEKPPKVPLTLRLPRALYEELKEEAEFRGLSLHEYILVKLNPLAVEFEQR